MPRLSTVRSRAGSVPPQTYRATSQRPITVSSLAGQTAQPATSAATSYRRASICVPNGTTYRTASSYRSPPPIHTYHPDKGLTLVTNERRVASQRPPVVHANSTHSAAVRRGSVTRPGAGTYYRVKTVQDDDDFGPAPAPAPIRRSGSISRKVVTQEQFVENGHRKPKVTVELEPTQIYVPNNTLIDLRERTKVAKDKMDKHRVLLDRYLPIDYGHPEDVEFEVQTKYGELVERMPQLEYSHRSKASLEEPVTYSNIEPYKPAQRSTVRVEPLPPLLPPVRNSFTPKVSDVRKRARRVLCSIKGDPRYFDFS